MMRRWRFIVALGFLPLVACAGSSPAPAQPAAAPKAGAAKASPSRPANASVAPSAAKPSAPPAGSADPQAAYVYEGAGRRDPFNNVLNTGAIDLRTTTRGEGAAGLLVNEIVVRAVVQSSTKTVALIQGPDGRSYNIHIGDKLMDGTVKSINPLGLVIMQEVNDPLSTAKQREVRKLLRSPEEAKQ